MSAKILSAALVGIDAEPIEIESDVSNGMPKFIIVGLPDTAVKEARERVMTALKNSGFAYPRTRLTVNLAPADIKKEGPSFDLPIAVTVMANLGEIKYEAVRGAVFLGELALDGSLRPVAGVLSAAIMAARGRVRTIFVPEENAREAALVEGLEVFGVRSLRHLADHLNGIAEIESFATPEVPGADAEPGAIEYPFDFADIAGLEFAKRGMEIAAAGNHNILLSGSPGSGKTLLARAMPSILPAMTRDEALEATRIASVAGILPRESPLLSARPWRSPHHSSSAPALIGGGSAPKPGEVTLAHRGVLFLDEFPEFQRPALEGLRQPLEDRFVTVSRVSGTMRYPANFLLVAARNPCPCGYYGDPERQCECPAATLMRYQKKISGPLLDRLDLYVEVPRTSYEKLSQAALAESSSAVRARVEAARAVQIERGKKNGIITNSDIPSRLIKKHCAVPKEAEEMLLKASRAMRLSPRAVHRSLKVARTIADLAGHENIAVENIAEALQYRPKTE